MSMTDSLFRSLVSALGVTPEQVTGAINLALSELETLKQEREAFKRGAGQMVAHFNKKLIEHDEKLDRIETTLAIIVARFYAEPQPVNGKVIEHERHTV